MATSSCVVFGVQTKTASHLIEKLLERLCGMATKPACHGLCAGGFHIKIALNLDPGIFSQYGGMYAANSSRSNDSNLVWHSRFLLV